MQCHTEPQFTLANLHFPVAGLFTLTSLLPLPWRMYDSCEIFLIVHYARTTNKRRLARGLPPLRDPNDLPDPIDAEVNSTVLSSAHALMLS